MLQTVIFLPQTAADDDLPPALAETWFWQLQTVSAIVSCLELWEVLRGPVSVAGGSWLFKGAGCDSLVVVLKEEARRIRFRSLSPSPLLLFLLSRDRGRNWGWRRRVGKRTHKVAKTTAPKQKSPIKATPVRDKQRPSFLTGLSQ